MKLFLPTYVIKSWQVSEQGPFDQHGTLIHITGRKAGLLAWFMSIAGIDPTFSLRADARGVYHEEGSLFGYYQRMTVYRHIAAVDNALLRPIRGAILVFSLLCVLLGSFFGKLLGEAMGETHKSYYGSYTEQSTGGTLFGVLVGSAVALGIAILYYKFNKRLTIGFSESSGASPAVAFKPSLIEGNQINEAAALRVATILRQLVVYANSAGPTGR